MIGCTGEAGKILQRRHRRDWGAIGYWAFDNLVLWASYHAFGSLPLTVILMGYLIGQLGGALPLPGRIGGIDLGLIGTLIVYGAPRRPPRRPFSPTGSSCWLPLVVGVAFASPRYAERPGVHGLRAGSQRGPASRLGKLPRSCVHCASP